MNNDWVVKGKMKREMWPITRGKWRIKGDGGQEAGKLDEERPRLVGGKGGR